MAHLALLMLTDMDTRALRRIKIYFGTALRAWKDLKDLPPQLAGGSDPELRKRRWIREKEKIHPERVLEKVASKGIKVLMKGEEGYPPLLAKIFDPPELIFLLGEVGLRDDRMIAVVGSRKGTSYGCFMAEQLALGLSERGIGVVSGAAYGIDAAAHKGSLKAGGPTFAVLGCGFDHLYPAGHRELFAKIREKGSLISEYPPHTPPQAWLFPERNRIIAGISQGVVVVEAGLKSGALITGDFALEEGREVFALPGSISNPLSAGPHRLIQQGAKLVTGVEDILEEFGWSSRLIEKGVMREDLTLEERELIKLFPPEPIRSEALLQGWNKDAGSFFLSLTNLLLKGMIREEVGGYYVKVHH
jgi:DNA processing protein